MRVVRIQDLLPGSGFDGPLYTRHRRLLLAAGTPLTDEMCSLLRESGEAEAYVLERAVEVRLLRGDQGVRTEPEREDLSETADEDRPARLNDRQRDRERELVQARARLRQSAERAVVEHLPRWERLARRVGPGHDPVRVAPETDRAEEAGDALLQGVRADGVGALRRLLGRLLDCEPVDAQGVVALVDELLDQYTRRPGRFGRLALGLPRPADSIPDHCYTTGALCVGIAARLGWSRGDVRVAGVAGMLADAGTALVSPAIRRAGRPLTDVEANSVRRHATYSVAVLRLVSGLPEAAHLAAYQHHERLDGTGYPTGTRGEDIHDAARVVGVADTLAGMTAPRAHRPALTAHAALSELASQAAAGKLDRPCVRAAVETLGLFPAGSFVRLSTGHVAMVVASGAALGEGRGDRPLVRVVQPEGAPTPLGEVLDLAWWDPAEVRVIEAVGTPAGF